MTIAFDPAALEAQLAIEEALVAERLAEVTDLREHPPTLWRMIRRPVAAFVVSVAVAIAGDAFLINAKAAITVQGLTGAVVAAFGWVTALCMGIVLVDQFLFWRCRAETLEARQEWLDAATSRRDLIADLHDYAVTGTGDTRALVKRAIQAVTAGSNGDMQAERFRAAVRAVWETALV